MKPAVFTVVRRVLAIVAALIVAGVLILRGAALS